MTGMVAYTDFILAPIALKLSQTGYVTCQRLSDESGIPHPTVKRAIRRLVENEILLRSGKGRKWGYIYRRGERFADIGS